MANPGGTLPFTVVDKDFSGSFAGGFGSGNIEVSVSVDAAGQAHFLVDNISFQLFGSPDSSQLIIDQALVTTTAIIAPVATTGTASSVSGSAATLNASVNPNGDSAQVFFQYGSTASYGGTTSTTTIPLGLTTTPVAISLAGLTSGSTYHFRVEAVNTSGTTFGLDQTFTTTGGVQASAPTVVTGSATSVTSTSATLNGSVNPNGTTTSAFFEYGLTTAYGTTTSVQAAGSGTTAQALTANIAALISGTTYHFRLTGSNAQGTVSGSDATFATPAATFAPTVVTGSATSVTGSTATLNGSANPNGAATGAFFEYGLTTSYGTTTTVQAFGSGTAAQVATANIASLISGTTYHFRLTGSNSQGLVSGSDMTFATLSSSTGSAPTVVTNAATSVTATTATLNGSVNPDGAATGAFFEYGLTTSYGTTTTVQAFGSGTAVQVATANIAALVSGTTYHFRLTGSNSQGLVSGSDMTFATLSSSTGSAPTVVTNAATSVTATTATLNGSVNPDGAATGAFFEYGLTTSYGTTTTVQAFGSGTAAQVATANIAALVSGTTYHFRLTGSNSQGLVSGSDMTFATTAVVNSGTTPTVTTDAATATGTAGATLNATVNPNGGATSVSFQYGLTGTYGSTTSSQTNGSGTTVVQVALPVTGLTPAATYNFRAVAVSGTSTVYGANMTFATTFSFATFAGKYAGAFVGLTNETSGLLSVTVSKTGAFSAAVKIDDKSLSFSGKFSTSGTAAVTKFGQTVNLVLGGSNGNLAITGNLSGLFQVPLSAGKLFAGKMTPIAYTVRIPHPGDPTVPQGNGYGSLTVSKTGAIRLAGKLGDGTAFSASGGLLANNTFPFYSLLYSKKGSAVGTVQFETTVNGDLDAVVGWFKPATSGTYTPEAIERTVNMYGSVYVKPAKGVPVISTTVGNVVLAAGNLPAQGLSFAGSLSTTNKFTVSIPPSTSDSLKITVVPATGLFSGSFIDSSVTPAKTRKFSGALIQGGFEFGTGVFGGTTEAGSVDIFP